jgi:hypothetical protein
VNPNDYMEGLFREAFRRELDVDENVARTLPFFAATLALEATLYGYILTRLPHPELTLLSLWLHGLLFVAAASAAGVLWTLFQAVRVREYRIPPKEIEQLAWAGQLKSYYEDQGLTPKTVEGRVAEQLRDRMILEFAEAVEHNRKANAPKLRARALGFTLLTAMLFIAFLMIATIFIAERVATAPPEGGPDAQASEGFSFERQSPAPAREAARAAEGSGDASRGKVPRCSDCEHGEQVSADPTGKSPAPAPAAPTPSPANSPPTPPTSQVLKKSDSSGRPITRR